MHAPSRLVFCLACFVLVVLAVTAGCTSSPAPSAVSPSPAPATTGTGNSIAIKNFAFDPSTLTIKTGSSVTWTNQDRTPHIVNSDTGSPAPFSSATLSTGDSYTFTFSQPGTYPYYCSLHPSMRGTIIVQG